MQQAIFIILLLFSVRIQSSEMKSKLRNKSHLSQSGTNSSQSIIKLRGSIKTRYYSDNYDDYFSVKESNITESNCPKPNEIDRTNGICYCQKGMANYPFTGYKGVYCQYKQKSQLTSFLLELLTGIGIGHFIIQQHIKGSFKLILILFPIIIGCLGLFGVIKTKSTEGTSGLIMTILLYLSLFSWSILWLIDLIMFGLNKYRDTNAVPLNSW